MTYNATVYELRDGQLYGTFVAELRDGKIVRSNAIQCTGLEGNLAYDAYIRARMAPSYLDVVLDNCEGYREKLGELMLPPAYRV